jgi:hypothetical protein
MAAHNRRYGNSVALRAALDNAGAGRQARNMPMKIAGRAINESPRDLTETGRHAKARFEALLRAKQLEEQWDKRHPLYARMLYFPLVGAGLRERRQSYVKRMSTLLYADAPQRPAATWVHGGMK